MKYTYGNKNASYNRVGRLMLQEDATGAQEFGYDRLGNVNKVRRTVIIPNQAIATYVTEWKYDSWNRLEEMIYPDLEKITYSYNTAGLLESVKGEKAYSYNYVNKLGYDKFEQRIYMKYCNGAETNYSYDQRRRLSNLSVSTVPPSGAGGLIMNNNYTFDAVDNVLSVVNTAPLPTTGMGGQMNHTYNYDGLYRLQSATGTYTGSPLTPGGGTKSASYTLEMQYDNLHNITSKKQHIEQSGVQFDGILKAGYDLSYNYSSEKPHQIANLKDENYRTEGTENQDKTKKDHAYKYDANGNLVYINTSREKQDGQASEGANERKRLWDEENRLTAINTNGFISGYWYDASGERVVKTSGDDEGIYVNDVFSGARTETGNFTAYINPYLVVSKGGNYTKHIYIGSQRIVSKLGDLDSYGSDPRRIEYAGSNVDGAKVDYKAKYKQSQQQIKDNYANFEVPYYGKDNDDYVNGSGFCCNNTPRLKSFDPSKNDNPELFQYYYHSDHLGSSSLITNLDGETVQHVEYVPFGEVFIEERNNTWNTPYLFNAKELDEETGLYYYSTRYYDPRISIFYGVDPLVEETSTPYQYCFQNPVKFIDPDGKRGRPTRNNRDMTRAYNMARYGRGNPRYAAAYPNGIRPPSTITTRRYSVIPGANLQRQPLPESPLTEVQTVLGNNFQISRGNRLGEITGKAVESLDFMRAVVQEFRVLQTENGPKTETSYKFEFISPLHEVVFNAQQADYEKKYGEREIELKKEGKLNSIEISQKIVSEIGLSPRSKAIVSFIINSNKTELEEAKTKNIPEFRQN